MLLIPSNTVSQAISCMCILSTCRIDMNNVIKVSDFGLSENVYARNYFREGQKEGIKLPFKWMAIESFHDAIFTEKTDVVSHSIACAVALTLFAAPVLPNLWIK